MALSKSQITSKLKASKIQCYALDNNTFYVPTKDRKTTLQQIYGMFMVDGAKPVQKSLYSATGAVKLGSFNIVVTRDRYTPAKPSNLPSGNDSVKNRLSFGAMVHDVLANTLKPLTVVFDGGKKITVKNVTGAKFEGKGIADFVLMQGNKPIPLAVHRVKGSYRHRLTGRHLEFAYDALEKVTMDGDIDASMEGDRMTLNAPVVFDVDSRSVRELMFQDLNNGVGIVGDFKPGDFNYDGKSNTLTIKCHRVYQTATDLKSEDKPFYVIVNSLHGQIGELKGLQVDLVPKRSLPQRMVLADI